MGYSSENIAFKWYKLTVVFYSFGRKSPNTSPRMADNVLCREKVKTTINDGAELLKEDINFFLIFFFSSTGIPFHLIRKIWNELGA